MASPALKRFVRYSTIGIGTFVFDLLLLWICIEVFGAPTVPATAIAFLIAVSLNFVISRRYVFKGSERSLKRGYAYFITYAVVGMFLTAGLMWLLTAYTNLHYTTIRVLIAGFIGAGNYVANLYLNFKVAGVHS